MICILRKFPLAIAAAIAVAAVVATAGEKPVSVASISADDLVEYADQPEKVRELIDYALSLTKQELGYRYGSNSPKTGGMDCSGTVQHALASVDLQIPRSSYTQFLWARSKQILTEVKQVHSVGHPSLKSLKPGDLLFWTGTYAAKDRDPPISHVMIFLGTLKADGKPVMFGASSGRRYRGKSIHGVSVFDFKVPTKESNSRFVAFGSVSGLRTGEP